MPGIYLTRIISSSLRNAVDSQVHLFAGLHDAGDRILPQRL
jgi:hypothetical protein